MTETRRSVLIAIDWGTTSARAYRIDEGGAVLDRRSAPLGIQNVGDRQWRTAFDALLGDWRELDAPRIACGMIGSRQGWVEAPYAACPTDFAGLGSMLVRTPAAELAIVPGARCVDAAGTPDVMRGEETQLAGALETDDATMLAVMPGTHSKWAIVERGSLRRFATFMTGELYALLLEHGILGRMADPVAVPTCARDFERGVGVGLNGTGLSHDIFGARTLALAGELAPAGVSDWLSGVLIGNEIRSACAWASAPDSGTREVTVIGGEDLVARYSRALAIAGITARSGPPDAAARGLFRIAQRSGLLH